MSPDIAGRRFWNHEKTTNIGRSPADTSPAAPSELPDAYLFLGWTLDLRRHALSKAGEEHHLRVKTYDVLVYLARHAGRVVGKQELLDAVWGDVAVTEDSLVQCLMEIRRTLGDTHETVKTVRGRGYMLDARVEPLRLTSAPVSALPRSPSAPPAVLEVAARQGNPSDVRPAIARENRGWWWIAGLTTLALVAAVFAAWLTRPKPELDTARVTSQQTMNPEARRAFDEGVQARQRLNQADMQRARQLFARAVALDPTFAPAHAFLANQLTTLSVFGVEPPTDVMPQAISEAQHAVELDSTLSQAWTALGHSTVQGAWDWAPAEAAYRRAAALDPSDPAPRFLLAHLLASLGRTAEALSESMRARELAPDSAQMAASNGIVLYWARQHDASRDAFLRAIELNRSAALAHFWMALNYVSLGDLDAGMTAALAAREEMANAPAWVVGYVHAAAGRRAEALEVLRALEAHRSRTYVSATDLAFLHAGLGQLELALDWLEIGVQERSRWMEIIGVIPVMDPLRNNPRFKKILRAVHLPEAAERP